MEIIHDSNNRKFILTHEGKSGRLIYDKVSQQTLDYKSTFVDEEIRGEGYGEALVKFALDFASENGYQVIPTCRMVAVYIARHKEYENLVA